jgi:hypothetical protein
VGKAAKSNSAVESTDVLLALEKSSEGECDPKEKPAEAEEVKSTKKKPKN